MPTVPSELQEELLRAIRRELSAAVRPELAALKRRVENLERLVTHLQKTPNPGFAVLDAERDLKGFRYTARGVRAQRDRLGLSAEAFGRLLGVSSQAVYNWEHGVSYPRPALLDKLAALRTVSRREARARLRTLAEGGGMR